MVRRWRKRRRTVCRALVSPVSDAPYEVVRASFRLSLVSKRCDSMSGVWANLA